MLCESTKCTGCCACRNVCPRSAIEMKMDEFGFYHPSVDDALCIQCGLCEKACPELHPVEKRSAETVYAIYATNERVRASSTSGGLAQVLCGAALEMGWVVYSHAFTDQFELKCHRITSENQLKKANGTKYVQSFIGDAIKQLRKDLKEGKHVVFVGTPCQVAGVENAVKPLSANLLTVSFVCGGVPSNKFFLEHISNQRLDELDNFHFRDNNQYGLYGFSGEQLALYEERWTSEYFIGFDEHVTQRKCCYSCRYASPNRVGDITIGDFWGIEATNTSIDCLEKGVSLCLITTQKGRQMIELCKKSDLIYMEEHVFAEATQKNPRLLSPVAWNEQAEKFRTQYLRVGFDKAIKKMYGPKYAVMRLKRMVKKIKILDVIYHRVKKHD